MKWIVSAICVVALSACCGGNSESLTEGSCVQLKADGNTGIVLARGMLPDDLEPGFFVRLQNNEIVFLRTFEVQACTK